MVKQNVNAKYRSWCEALERQRTLRGERRAQIPDISHHCYLQPLPDEVQRLKDIELGDDEATFLWLRVW